MRHERQQTGLVGKLMDPNGRDTPLVTDLLARESKVETNFKVALFAPTHLLCLVYSYELVGLLLPELDKIVSGLGLIEDYTKLGGMDLISTRTHVSERLLLVDGGSLLVNAIVVGWLYH